MSQLQLKRISKDNDHAEQALVPDRALPKESILRQ